MPRVKAKRTEYYQDQADFLQKLKEFHQARGTTICRLPTFGGQSLDLYALYNTVTSFGGILVVTDKKKWDEVFIALGFPPCTNAAYALRQHYARYLQSYERIFFFGEDDDVPDPNQLLRNNASKLRYKRVNRPLKLGSLGEPLVHNFNRISYSLQSGLQNEVNFALNICALLSNVTNSIFNLAKSSNILDLILAHVGIWDKNDATTQDLYKEWYRGKEEALTKFWLDTLKEPVSQKFFKDNLDNENGNTLSNELESSIKYIFFTEDKKSVTESNIYFARVNQVAFILYNFSFEQVNAMYMANHKATQRFLLLSSYNSYATICKSGLETLDNVSHHMLFSGKEEEYTQDLMCLLYKFISSVDKFKRGRAMSIIGKLALNEENTSALSSSLTSKTYQRLIEMLYLPDIVLILSALDALYALSDLCETTATAIASVHGGIDVLVCLLTIRAESFGNEAIQGFRIVENKHSMFTQKNQEFLKAREAQRFQQNSMNIEFQHKPNYQSSHSPNIHRQVSSQPVSPHYAARPHFQPMLPLNQQPHNIPPPNLTPQLRNMNLKIDEELVEIDAEIFCAHWLSAFYEPSQSEKKISLLRIYEDFCNTCNEFKRKTVLPISHFERLLKIVLPPHVMQAKPEVSPQENYITGVQRRKVPIQIQSNIPKSMHEQLLKNKPLLLKNRSAVAPDKIRPTATVPLETKENNDITHTNPPQIKMHASLTDFQMDPLFEYILKNKNLDSVSECQEIIEQVKVESQTNFTQFHTHRQYLQSLQIQLHQLMLQQQQHKTTDRPPDVVKDVALRTQMHHQHMQLHYTKLQALSNLSTHVQHKLLQNQNGSNAEPGLSSNVSRTSVIELDETSSALGVTATPMTNGIVGSFSPPINNTFSISPNKPRSGKGSRGGRTKFKSMRGNSPKGRGSKGRATRGRGKGSGSDAIQFNSFGNVSQPANSPFVTATGTIPSYSLQQSPLRSPFTHSPTSGFLPASRNNITQHFPGSQINPTKGPVETNINSTFQINNIKSNPIDFNRTIAKVPDSSQFHSSEISSVSNVIYKHQLEGDEKMEGNDTSVVSEKYVLCNKSSTPDIEIDVKSEFADTINKKAKLGISSKHHVTKHFENLLTDQTTHVNGNITKCESEPNRQPLVETQMNENDIIGVLADSNIMPVTSVKNIENLTNGFLTKNLNENVNESIDWNLSCQNSESKNSENDYLGKHLVNNVEQSSVASHVSYSKMNGFHNNTLKPVEKRQLNGRVSPNDVKKIKLENNSVTISVSDNVVTNLNDTDGKSFKETNDEKIEPFVNQSHHLDTVEQCTKVSEEIKELTDQNHSRTKGNELKLNLTTNCSHDLAPSCCDLLPNKLTANNDPKKSSKRTDDKRTVKHQYFRCMWKSCELPEFKKASSLLSHMIHAHAPLEGKIFACNVDGCSKEPRLRGSMITHFQEVHCITNKHDGTFSKVALSEKLFKKRDIPKPRVEDESPVTRSIRFTAALILRNIARSSPYGKSLIRYYESNIAMVAMSPSEAATAASYCLAEISSEDKDVNNPIGTSDVEISDVEDDEQDLFTYMNSHIS